jgi:hypothetical protein
MRAKCLRIDREVQAISEDELPWIVMDRNGLLSPDIAFLCGRRGRS